LARPTEHHLHAARHALKYLKGTAKLGLKLGYHGKSKSIEQDWLNQKSNDSLMKSDIEHQMDEGVRPGVATNMVRPREAHNDSDLINRMTMKSSETNVNWMDNYHEMTHERLYDEEKETITIENDRRDEVDIETYVSTDKRDGKKELPADISKQQRSLLKRKRDTNENETVSGMSDANWGSDEKDRRSVTGMILKLFGSPVSWVSKRQATVALSTTEAEYMAVSATVQEALWFKMWMKEVLNKDVRIPIGCDNQAAIRITGAESDSQRTKHIDIRHHFIRDHVSKGDINIKWVATEKQQADLLTKRLATHRFKKLRDLLLVECD
jgi:hypothetical protein